MNNNMNNNLESFNNENEGVTNQPLSPTNNPVNDFQNVSSPVNNTTNERPKKFNIKKIVLIFIGAVIVIIALVFGIIFLVSKNSDKLVCKSNKGNITLIYNDKTITGYVGNGISYDLDEQSELAEQLGVDAYLESFTTWFSANTDGTCTVQKK